MKILKHQKPQDPLRQIACGPAWLSDSEFEELQTVAARFWFTVQDHADGSLTIHGPGYNLGIGPEVSDVNVRLPRHIAKLRLLSEVCCAMAASTNVFEYVDNPLLVPFTDDRSVLSNTSLTWRKMHTAAYASTAAEQAILYPAPVPEAPVALAAKHKPQ